MKTWEKRLGSMVLALAMVATLMPWAAAPTEAEGTAEAETSFTYQAEDYYYKKTGNNEDCADLQPGDSISIQLSTNADFVAGKYTLVARTCGDRTTINISVNDQTRTISRTGTGWGDMTEDTMDGEALDLTTSDTITITAPSDGKYGWVDCITLTKVSEEPPVDPDPPAIPDGAVVTDEDFSFFQYEVEHFYYKQTGNNGAKDCADLQANDSIEISLDAKGNFKAGDYTLKLRGGSPNAATLEVWVDGTKIGDIDRTATSDWGVLAEYDLAETLTLEKASTLTIKDSAGAYTWVDWVKLTKVPDEPPVDPDPPAIPDGAVVTDAENSFYQYETEHFYTAAAGQTDGINDGGNCANLQGDGHIDIPLNVKGNFTPGKYTLTLFGCGEGATGNIEVKIGENVVGVITRNPTSWGGKVEHSLTQQLDLNGTETIILKDSNGTCTWVDWVKLTKVPDEPPVDPDPPVLDAKAVEADNGRYVYQVEYFYTRSDGGSSTTGPENSCADLQQNDSIVIPLNTNSTDVTETTYSVTVRSNGNRAKLQVWVNDALKGTIERTGTDFNENELTANTLTGVLTLKATDKVTLKDPDGAYGWVDYLELTPCVENGDEAAKTSRFVYQAEADGYYTGTNNAVAVDLQPRDAQNFVEGTDVITIPLGDIKEGAYFVGARSNGNRKILEIRVNGRAREAIGREGTDFGLGDMTYSETKNAIWLKAGDILTITGPKGAYGWVDFMTLRGTAAEAESFDNGPADIAAGNLAFDPIYFSTGNISNGTVEMKADEEIAIPLKASDSFQDGTYIIAVQTDTAGEVFEVYIKTGDGAETFMGKIKSTVKSTVTGARTRRAALLAEEEEPKEFLEVTLAKDDTVKLKVPSDGAAVSLTGLTLTRTVSEEEANRPGEGWFVYQGENLSGNLSADGTAAVAASGSELAIAMPADLKLGKYTLILRSSGSRTTYNVAVNGNSPVALTRTSSDLTLAGMNYARLNDLVLGPGDIVHIVAPTDAADVTTDGWVDFIALSGSGLRALNGSPTHNEGVKLVYDAEYFYHGKLAEGMAADLQPGESIDIPVDAHKDFPAEEAEYELWIRSCGNRESFDISVNGQKVGTLTRTGTDFGQNQMTNDKLGASFKLKAGDKITITSPASGYGWVDAVYLKDTTKQNPPPSSGSTRPSPVKYPQGEEIRPTDPAATGSGKGYYLYQTEYYYKGNISEGVAADLQPNEAIKVALDTNPDFTAGRYILILRSCGNREKYEVLVNGEHVGTIKRSGTGFGQDQMTASKLEGALELKPGDKISIVAPNDKTYGWVDSLRLVAEDAVDSSKPDWFVPSEEATQVTESHYCFQTEYFYNGKISEGVAADLQPGQSIEVWMDTIPDFVEGDYTLTLRSCGNRESYDILLNGEAVGTLHRTGNGFGQDQMTEDSLDAVLNLKGTDVITIAAPNDDTYGWVDDLKLTIQGDKKLIETQSVPTVYPEEATQVEEGCLLYQTEYFYHGSIVEEVAADLQPGERIEIPLDANQGFQGGEYILSLRSCGNRESYDILLNGEAVGALHRTSTGFGQDQMTDDRLEIKLDLKPGDKITLAAPNDGTYGWVDSLKLTASGDDKPAEAAVPAELPEGAVEVGKGYVVYQTEHFYKGSIVEEVAADLQPGESIDITLDDSFTAGTYNLWLRSCGNRESYDILLNGEAVGALHRTGTGFGQDQMTDDRLEAKLDLKPGDKITLAAPNDGTYGWVDSLRLDTNDWDPKQVPVRPVIGKATETGDGYFLYQAEGYYSGNLAEGTTADLQPGETIQFRLADNQDFRSGTYTLTIYSCGNREEFTILVNGKEVGRVSRSATGFGMDQMTYDKLSIPLELKSEDTLTLQAPSGEYWGWVDFIILDVGDQTGSAPLEGEPTEAGDGYFLYQSEFFYDKVAEGMAADLQPGTVIDIPLNSCEGFTAGWYNIIVAACGPRKGINLRINGKVIGSVSRLETGFGADEMTEDRFSKKVELGPDDVLTLSAPDDGTYGWVDYVKLVAAASPAGTAEEKDDIGAPAETVDETAKQDTEEKSNSILPVVIGIVAAAAGAAGAAVAAVKIRRRKSGDRQGV